MLHTRWDLAGKWLALAGGLALLLAACTGSQGLEVGDPAPEFTLPEAGGGQVSLADYEGTQPVLLYFHMAVG